MTTSIKQCEVCDKARLINFINLFMNKLLSLNNKIFKITLFSIIVLEFFSLYAFVYPILNKAFFVLILLGALYLASKNLAYGVYMVLAELIIASKGYLFYFELGNKSISIRIAIFLAIMAVWLIKTAIISWQRKKLTIPLLKSKIFPYYLALFFFIGWGIISGIIHNNNLGNIFFDFNGWLYFALIFPLFEIIKKENINSLLSVILAALTALVLKTFIIFFIFSQQINYAIPGLYRWIRITGVGEITDMGFGFSRIFFQSHIYAVLGFFTLLPLIADKLVYKREMLKNNAKLLGLIASLAAIIIISFSRSFWVGTAATFFIYFLSLIFVFKEKIRHLFARGLVIVSIFLIAISMITLLVKIPLPGGDGSVDISSVLNERTTNLSEAAIGSRWNLIKPLWQAIKANPLIGSGFGKTVTYKTLDPRALEANLTNEYTAYAFEWGYLDIWLKLGLLGLAAYLVLIWKILKEGWKYKDNKLFLGSLLGITALLATHFFTPYLNHPLGIGYLMLLSVIYEKNR